MSAAVPVLAEKIKRTTRSMVYLAVKNEPRRGHTADDISHLIATRLGGNPAVMTAGYVERVLAEMSREGMVRQERGRWYPVAGAA